MPVTEVAKRKQRYQQLEDQLVLWDKHLEDQDWIERLAENADYKKLCGLLKEDMEMTHRDLDQMKKTLCEMPMGPDKTVELKEKVMVMARDHNVLDNLLSFADREVERLNEIRKLYPQVKAEFEQLKKEGEIVNG